MTAAGRRDGAQLTPEQEQAAARRNGARLTPEQEQAAARRSGSLLLAAGAGSGKTAVLAERFVRAVREDGLAPGRILAITFTERAAGELRERIRARLIKLRERDAAREAEAAFISTFHGFCARLLRAHPLAAGLDPRFTVMEEGLAGRLAQLAFREVLASFVHTQAREPVELTAAYGADALERIVLDVHAQLRSQGQTAPRLPSVAGEERGARACRLIDDLLGRFGAAYAARKRTRAAVDFDDLELLARDLLRARADIRDAWAERFHMLMVDEFQDTNARQLELLELLNRDNLFTVGDELQSIYGFRHADVELFRERHRQLEQTGAALRLTHNFRSRAPILAAVDRVFSARIGKRYTPLVPARPDAARRPDEVCPSDAASRPDAAHDADEPLVELLLGDCRGPQPWREAEARLLAERVAQLVAQEEARPGDVAVLLRALGDLPLYEEALRAVGLPTLAAGGGFWGHQQVRDLVAYLRALANPLDELALYSTLACPLVGLSSDALALIAEAARQRRCGAWEAIERHGGDLEQLLPGQDRACLVAFADWFARERRAAPLLALGDLLRRVLEGTGYYQYVLSLPWGQRRLANVHKLVRLARAYEAQEGRELRGFLEHVDHLGQSLTAREAEAPPAHGQDQAVQLMSIHAAKGLEFPVVCLADLGRAPRLTVPDLLVEREGRVGLRLRRLGEPESEPALDFGALCAEAQAAQQREEDRILYVAMTRARDRLLLSGAADFGRWPADRQGAPPVSWLAPALVPDVVELAGRGETITVELGSGLRVRCTFGGAHDVAEQVTPAPSESPRLSPPAQPSTPTKPGPPTKLGPRPATVGGQPLDTAGMAPLDAHETISYSSLAELERCGYRYYLERVLHLPEDRVAAASEDQAGLEARTRGTLVHMLLERTDFARPLAPTDDDVKRVAHELGIIVDGAARAEIVELIQGALASGPARRLASARGALREHPFSFSLGPDRPLVTGVLDLIVQERPGAILVVDYKSDRVQPGEDLEQIVARDYSIQRLLYALAVLQGGAAAGHREIDTVEVAHWFLERPGQWVSVTFEPAQAPKLREWLLERIDRLRRAGYAVAEQPHRGICLTCPGRRALCSWEERFTLREPPGALETQDDLSR